MREMTLIFMIALITFFCRALPFLIFSGKKELPQIVLKLEKQLPVAVMIMLVLYCLRSISFQSFSGWIPLCGGVLMTVFVHLKQKNVLLSILAGTLVHMIFVQLIF